MREKGYLNLKTTSNEGRVRKAIEICKKNLKRVLRNNAAEIISVGSAAIKDIKMRPSVDFLVSATSEKELSICADLLKTTGYTQIQTSSDLYPLFFIGSAPCRLSCTIRLVLANSKAYWTAVNFRDYLNINSSRKSEYEQIKLSALQKHPGDSAGYNEAKTVFLDRIGGEVRDWKIFTSSFTVSEIKRLNPEKTDISYPPRTPFGNIIAFAEPFDKRFLRVLRLRSVCGMIFRKQHAKEGRNEHEIFILLRRKLEYRGA